MILCNMVVNAEGKAKNGRETSLHLSTSLTIRGRMNKHEYANQKRPQRPPAFPNITDGSQVGSSGTAVSEFPSSSPHLFI